MLSWNLLTPLGVIVACGLFLAATTACALTPDGLFGTGRFRRRLLALSLACAMAALAGVPSDAQSQAPPFFVPGRNVNTLGPILTPPPPGTPDPLSGNPYGKQRNEPSCDVSPYNQLVVLCAYNDYRGIPVLCTYHPAYLLRSPEKKKEVWDDMKVLLAKMGRPVPK